MIWTLSSAWQRWRVRVRPYWLQKPCRVVLLLAVVGAAAPAGAAEFAMAPTQNAVGQLGHYVVRKGEVLADIARRFDVGYTELVAANPGVDPWIPQPGTEITIPALYILPAVPHQGIVVNLGDYRLFYFPGGGRVFTYPLGLGVIGWQTPLGTTRIVVKEPHPIWYPPASMRAVEPDLPRMVPAGPANPLGNYALHLGWPRVLIHGTDKPDGVGRNVSHGCIHLYPEDIEQLFSLVRVGTPVRTIDEPAAAAWIDDQLYLAVHPSPKQVQQIDLEQPVSPDSEHGVTALVQIVAGRYQGVVDWRAVAEIAAARTGLPIRIADRSAYVAQPQPQPPFADAGPGTAARRDDTRQADDPAAIVGPDAVPSEDPPQTANPDAAQSPAQAAQSFDRAMEQIERAERSVDRGTDQ
jgi:L,D-transpeptidase ErfK/SrfK